MGREIEKKKGWQREEEEEYGRLCSEFFFEIMLKKGWVCMKERERERRNGM